MSRTSITIKNSQVALSYFIINLLLNFISRKYFLEYLGEDVLGLNTTASNLLSFLNIAELGIGSAVACTLYKPLNDTNIGELNEIISLQGWLYKKIAYFVGFGGILLMLFFPLIFKKITLPMWYAYGSFSVLLFSSLLSYCVNYKSILLSADQKQYKIVIGFQSFNLLRTILQIFAVVFLANGYFWWLLIYLVSSILASINLERIVSKEYPNLKIDTSKGSYLSKRYPEIVKKIKQVFFHKIGSFVLSQTSPLIIYAYISLKMVALYGNYMILIQGVRLAMEAVFNSQTASIGNLIVENNQKHTQQIFDELFSARYIFNVTLCFTLYVFSPAFISLWIGSEYVLNDIYLILIILTLYINLNRGVVNSFIHAKGLFGDIWAPVLEGFLNLSLSILLGAFWGLEGILGGVIISLLFVVSIWKPYYLFNKGFGYSVFIYWILYLKHIVTTIPIVLLYLYLIDCLEIRLTQDILHFLLYLFSISVSFFVILLLVQACLIPSMRSFVNRLLKYIR